MERLEHLRWTTSIELVVQLAELEDAEALLGRPLDPSDPALRGELVRALERLPYPWAEVVRHRILGGCDHEQTAGEVAGPAYG